MSVKIITKHETGGTGDEPLSTDLEKGELGVNTVDGKLWVGDGASKKLLTGGGVVEPGTADGQTLRWEADNSAWEATSDLVVDDLGTTTISNDSVNIQAGGFPSGTARIYGTNKTTEQLGQLSIGITSGGVAAEFGGQLNFLANSTGSVNYPTGAIAGRKENTTDYAAYLQFSTSNAAGTIAEKMRIDSAGNVGIGTTPNTWGSVFTAVDIDTTGAIAAAGTFKATYVTSNMYFDGSVWKYKVNGAASHIAVGADNIAFINAASGVAGGVATNVETMRIDSSGNVGIGTDAPTTILQTQGTTTDNSKITMSTSGWSSAIGPTTTGSLVFYNGNTTERMRIDSSGAVGIGTSSPNNQSGYGLLNINGTTGGIIDLSVNDATGAARISSTATGLAFYASKNPNDNKLITFATSGNTERMSIDASGNVKINTGYLKLSHGGGWVQYDANWVRSLNDKGVFNASTAATAFATPGDFTAGYSDMRLKTHLGTIPDALDKVCSLEGFYYERNDVAQSLGYQGGERRVGLSAQDVQAVLPEVVKDAPINVDHGTDYLTVDYERVVPLLVESIKDLRAEIDELKRNQK